MDASNKQSLRFAENLTFPPVQVITMKAVMSCNHCRHRVSQIVSKMNGLMEYVVDVRKKEAVLRGAMEIKRRKIPEVLPKRNKRNKSSKCLLLNCSLAPLVVRKGEASKDYPA